MWHVYGDPSEANRISTDADRSFVGKKLGEELFNEDVMGSENVMRLRSEGISYGVSVIRLITRVRVLRVVDEFSAVYGFYSVDWFECKSVVLERDSRSLNFCVSLMLMIGFSKLHFSEKIN